MSELSKSKLQLFCQKLYFCVQKTHAHLQYDFNSCVKFQIDCLKTLGGVNHELATQN